MDTFPVQIAVGDQERQRWTTLDALYVGHRDWGKELIPRTG